METNPVVKLITHTPEPEKVVAIAAKICYAKDMNIAKIMDNLTEDNINKFINYLIELGHESPLEHVSFTFAIEGVSRALTHQLVRHRLASYSQRSQRYCSENDFNYIKPDNLTQEQEDIFNQFIENSQSTYSKLLLSGVKPEDARMVLPNACETKIVVTMNVRELNHFFKLRCCNRAQKEIRVVANMMRKLCKEVSPILFKYAGPSCCKGYCTEGNKCCGLVPNITKIIL